MARGLQIDKTGEEYDFASVQQQYTIDFEGHPAEEESDTAFRRDLVQIATLDEFRKNPAFAQNEENQINANDAIALSRRSSTTGTPGACPST